MDECIETPRSRKALKWLVIVLLALLLLWPLTFGVVWLANQTYTWLDPTRFPFSESKIHPVLKAVPRDVSEVQKGIALSRALTNRLEEELDSTFGWSVNDLWASPTRWLDNRASRQAWGDLPDSLVPSSERSAIRVDHRHGLSNGFTFRRTSPGQESESQ